MKKTTLLLILFGFMRSYAIAQPPNDLCTGATTLSVGATCINTLVTIDGTVTDSGIVDPGCAGYLGGDLWYKVTIPASGNVRIETDTNDSSITDGGLAVYTGVDCNNLTLLECDDAGNTDSLEDFERINVYGRTTGEVIYVRVWSFNNTQGTFNLCAVEVPNPSNDLCAGATTLPVNGTCINTLVNIDGTGTGSGVSNPGCANYSGGDLWYSLTVPASGKVSVVASSSGSLITAGMAIYTGADCNNLTKLTCAFNNGPGGFPSAKLSQPVGSTIYIRVWDINNDDTGTFNLCASEVVVATPSNNTSNGAADLTVGATCTNTLVTLDGTETDSGLGDPGCAGYVGGDLWYKVTIPASGNVKIETDTNGDIINDGGMAVYTGPDATTLTLLECDDAGNTDSLEDFERINVLGKTPGEIIYVRVWSFHNILGSFNICAVEIPNPSNDLCTGATVLPVGAVGVCSNTLVSIDGTATDSGVSDPDCANYSGGDLWYSLTVPASGIVSIDASTSGSLTIAGMAIYNGADCGSLNKLTCAFNNGPGGFPSAKVSQAAGSTIYVRVWDINNDDTGTFNLCASEVVASPPANNDKSGAINLVVDDPNTLITVGGTETDSGMGDPGCARYVGGDLWYQVTVPASGNVKVETDTNDSSITDGGMAVYTGPDINNLTLLECDDAGNTDSLEDFERINVLGRTPGEVIYVRVWSFNNTQGTFNIKAVEIPNPSNDLCTGATVLPVGAVGVCSNTLVSIDGTGTDSGVSDPGCANYSGGDLWYSLTVPASGIVSIDASTSGSLTIAGMAIYNGADCGSLNKLTCAFNNGPGGFPSAKVSQAAGSNIYVRVWDINNDDTGTFNLCASEVVASPPANNDKSGAINLVVDDPNTLITVGGTETDSGMGDPGCARYVGGDLWYQVTVPASGNVKVETDTNDSSITDGGMAVYTGPDINNLTLLECDDAGNTDSLEDFERISLLGRTPGEVVYVRVWSFNNTQGTFNIKAAEFHPLKNESADLSSFLVYPNPAKDIVHISLKNLKDINGEIRVYDLQGKLVLDNLLIEHKMTLDVSNLSKGLYFLKFENGNNIVTKKLIIE